ncbi:hypothetical protein FRC12_004405 [Ceratobasidium sp. 428]|nr:hypothetical protein FRC12_004405 [Ceratobasidium sp. 428]
MSPATYKLGLALSSTSSFGLAPKLRNLMSSPRSIFIFGATGYVGGTLLVALVEQYPSLEIRALVRNPKDVELVAAVGPSVAVVSGSHTDLDLVTTESSNADVVFQVADPDDLNLTQAIIAGLKIRQEKSGKRGILIHTTGTGTIMDEGTGEFTDDYPIWDDVDTKALKSIDINAPHRIVDLEAIKAHDEGIADVYVICPATIYGVGTGPVRRTSMQIPKLVEIYQTTRRAEYVAKGTNIWSNIHVQDLAHVFLLILDHAVQAQKSGDAQRPQDGFNNFYFTIAGEHTWGEVIAEIGNSMNKRGLLDSPEAYSVSAQKDPVLTLYSGSNSRAYSTRLKKLGWVPKEKSIKDTVDEDVEFVANLLAKNK